MAPNWGTSTSTLQGSSVPSRGTTARLMDFKFVRRMGGGGSPVQEFQEVASATFLAGQFVHLLAASGQIQETVAATTTALGLATKDFTGTAGTLIPVVVGLQDVIFEGTADTASQLAASDIGDLVDLIVTSDVSYVDLDASSTDLFQIVGYPAGATDSAHDNYGKVYVRLNDCQVGQTSGAVV